MERSFFLPQGPGEVFNEGPVSGHGILGHVKEHIPLGLLCPYPPGPSMIEPFWRYGYDLSYRTFAGLQGVFRGAVQDNDFRGGEVC